MPPRIFNNDRWTVEAHRLVVHYRAGESSKVLHLDVSRGVRDERETGSMTLWKAVEGERAYVLNDGLLRFDIEPVGSHAIPQAPFKILHSLPRAAHSHGSTKLFSLRTGEV